MAKSRLEIDRIIFRDLWRSLKSDKQTAALAIVSMALGLATATVTLSIVNSILHPLPYRAPEQIVELVQVEKGSGFPRAFSYRFFYDAIDRLPGVEALSPLSFSDLILTSPDKSETDPVVITGISCSASLFDILDIRPLKGRFFDRGEELATADRSPALISEELWRSRYNSDPNILGQGITLNERPFTIIGIVAAGIQLPPLPAAPGVWIPLGYDPLIPQVRKFVPSTWDRSAFLTPLWARIAKGYNSKTLEDQIRTAAVPLLVQDDPDRDPDADFHIVQVEEQIRSKYRPEVRVLAIAALVVLAVACFNVSSLILARALSRRPEIAVRLALGESRLRICTRVLLEGMLISALGALVGIVVAKVTLAVLESILPVGFLPFREVVLGSRDLILSLAIAIGCGIATSIWPALTVARIDGSSLLEGLHRSSTEGRSMKLNRQILVAAQIGCSVLALALFVCLFRTYRNLRSVNLGFHPGPVLIANLRLPQNDVSGERWKNIGTQLINELSGQEGVISAAISISPPVTRSLRTSYTIPGSTLAEAGGLADFRVVGPEYFDVLGISILKGRRIERSDYLKTRRVCLVNETFARSNFVDGQEIGSLVKPAAADPCEVVGVVADVASYNLRNQPAPAIYFPFDQLPADHIQGFISILVRTSGTVSNEHQIGRLAASIRRSAPALPASIQPLRELVAERSSLERFRALLMGGVSLLAVILAACGVFGVTTNYVARQRRAITIRLAVGATTARVIRAVLKDALVLTVLGLLLGFAVVVPILKALSGVLFGLAGLDAITITSCAVLMPLIACFSAYWPARQVAHMRVADVLRILKD